MNTVSDIKGRVFDIQRFCLHDGPGIRTTVFLKGCPLRCKWCHNPESWSSSTELFYHAGACIGCGKCVSACAVGAHKLDEKGHIFDRKSCNSCFACAKACPTGALELTGEEKSVSQVIATVLRDAEFYKDGGGMTVSGGEPFMQIDFLIALLKEAKRNGIHTCIETSGAADIGDMLKAGEYTDLFLYDCKMIPGKMHKEFIGTDGVMMHENLKRLDKSGAKTILRCPIIPGVNDSDGHFAYIAEMANALENLTEIHLQPYHTTGLPKTVDIGKEGMFFPDSFDARAFKKYIEEDYLSALKNSVSKKVVLL